MPSRYLLLGEDNPAGCFLDSLIINLGEMVMNANNRTGFVRLLAIAGQKKWHLIVSVLLAGFSSLCAMVPYITIYLSIIKLLDPTFGPQDYPYVTRLALWAVAGVLGRFFLLLASTMFSHVAAFNILYGLRAALARHLGTLHMGYFSDTRSGEIKKILMEDVEEIEQFIAHHVPDLASGVVLPVVTVACLFAVDWRMALVALIPLPLALCLQYFAFGSGDRDELMKNYHDSLEAMNGNMVEYVRGMPVVKVFNQSVNSFSRLKASVYAYRDFVNLWAEKAAPPWAAFTVITTSSLFFILPAGIWFYMKGSLSLSTLLLFLMMGSGYMLPLLKVALMGGTMSRIMEGVSRLDAILKQPGIKDAATPVLPERHSIEFRNVSFGYDDRLVLRNTSFFVEEGSVTALVGASGAGKSTIAQLLLRMWDVQDGEILVGGVDIREIPHERLMNLIGFVFQDAFMFSDTVYENIRMGMEGVTEGEVVKAAEAAQCMDFINALPHGLYTRIGEGGEVHLSGGERQRLSLARIFLKNAPIVILDEATAYADAENESKIQAAFSEVMTGRTVIVIAHRLSTITDADTILVIDDGGVAERGHHETLVEQGGLYRGMWDAHTAAKYWRFSINGGESC